MSTSKKYIGDLFLTARFFLAFGISIVLIILSFFFPVLSQLSLLILLIMTALVFFDYLFLFINKPPFAKRIMTERLSNGDENKIEIQVKNNMPFSVDMEIIDELPVQFQKRDWVLIQLTSKKYNLQFTAYTKG